MEKASSKKPGQDKVICPPVGFNRPVVQASYPYQNYKNAQPPQVSPQIQEFQRFIKNPPQNVCTNVPSFNFHFSNVNNDNNQGKIENSQQNISNDSSLQLCCPEKKPDQMTASSTNSSHQMIPVKAAQEEEKSSNAWNIKKLYVKKRLPIRKVPHFVPDPAPERKRTAPINPAYTIRKSRVANSVHMRPYKDRVMHLLALKDYKKPELLVRLQKDGIKKSDKNSLGKILYQVADLNTENFSYSLKDSMYKEIQRDWPGYNELDKQSLDLVLSRKISYSQNATDSHHPQSLIGCVADGRSSFQKQFSNLADPVSSMKKGTRISHLATTVQPTSNRLLINNNEKSTIVSPSATPVKQSYSASSKTYKPNSNLSLPVNSNRASYTTGKIPGTQDSGAGNTGQDNIVFPSQPRKHKSLDTLASISIQMKYPKLEERKKMVDDENFKYKCSECKAKTPNYNNEMTEKQKTDSKNQSEDAKPDSTKEIQNRSSTSENTCSTSELPDYLIKYYTINSSEQRQYYKQEFRADYNEYQSLYAKMMNLSRAFITLDSERKLVSPGSKEYQDINKRISLEYQKMRQLNPNFCAEKCRCIYLYNKLVHIKKLINDFDQQQVNSHHKKRCLLGPK